MLPSEQQLKQTCKVIKESVKAFAFDILLEDLLMNLKDVFKILTFGKLIRK